MLCLARIPDNLYVSRLIDSRTTTSKPTRPLTKRHILMQEVEKKLCGHHPPKPDCPICQATLNKGAKDMEA